MKALMAGNLHVRQLDDGLSAKLRLRATRHGRSAEAEPREILREALEVEADISFEDLCR